MLQQKSSKDWQITVTYKAENPKKKFTGSKIGVKSVIIVNSVNSFNSVSSFNSVNCVNSVNSDNSVHSVSIYSAVLPPSLMVFFGQSYHF